MFGLKKLNWRFLLVKINKADRIALSLALPSTYGSIDFFCFDNRISASVQALNLLVAWELSHELRDRQKNETGLSIIRRKWKKGEASRASRHINAYTIASQHVVADGLLVTSGVRAAILSPVVMAKYGSLVLKVINFGIIYVINTYSKMCSEKNASLLVVRDKFILSLKISKMVCMSNIIWL